MKDKTSGFCFLTTDLHHHHEKPKQPFFETWVDMVGNNCKTDANTQLFLAQTGNKVSKYLQDSYGSRRFIGGLFESNDERNQCRHEFD